MSRPAFVTTSLGPFAIVTNEVARLAHTVTGGMCRLVDDCAG
jgi:hypothetical protein